MLHDMVEIYNLRKNFMTLGQSADIYAYYVPIFFSIYGVAKVVHVYKYNPDYLFYQLFKGHLIFINIE